MTRLATLALLGVLVGTAAARAQTSCPEALADAEILYRAGQFTTVEAELEPCFRRADPPEAAFRLLALALVRQQRIDEAQEIVLRLLVAHPSYEPDPVQDPPVYVALVVLVRRQVGPTPRPAPPERQRIEIAAVAVAEPQLPAPRLTTRPLDVPAFQVAPARARPAWSAEVSLGMESYDGERRRVGGGLAGGFVRNGGPSPSLGAVIGLAPWLALDTRVQAVRLPALIRDGLPDDQSGYAVPPGGALGEPVTSYPLLDPSTTSRWVSSLSVGVRAAPWPGPGPSPYGRVAARVLTRRVNGAVRVAAGPEVALGASGGSRRVTVFGEVGGVLIVPDRALDAAQFRVNGDLLLILRAGIRLR